MAQVTHLRMRHAAELLVQTDLSVKELAPAVGYAEPFNFPLALVHDM